MYGLPPPPKRVQYQDEYDEDFDDVSDEQKQLQAQRCLKVFNISLMLLGGLLCGFAYYTGTGGFGGAWTAYAAAGVGGAVFFVTLMGFLGALRLNKRILLFYYTCLIFSAMSLLVLGGFSFILTEEAVRYMRENWDKILRNMPASQRETADEDEAADALRLNLRITGAISLFLFMLLLSAMGNVVRLISPAKAYQILLQSTNIAVMPMGVVLIAAGLYVADTAASVDAPYAAFAIFILGVAVIVISAVGCFGSSIESRGIIKLFMFLIFFQMLGVIAIGIAAFVQAEQVKQTVADNWDKIRKVLPPGFSGAYDKDQFMSFVESNLQAMGFLALCNGMLLLTQFVASVKLRKALKQEVEDDPFDGPSLPTVLSQAERPNKMKKLWKQRWTNGSKKSRLVIKLGCACVCFLVILLLTGAVLTLYFSTSCASISDYSQSQDYPSVAGANHLVLNNTFGRGSSGIMIDNSATTIGLTFTKGAFREQFTDDAFPSAQVSGNTAVLIAEPAPPKMILGFDMSCQTGEYMVATPNAAHYGGNSLAASKSTPTFEFNADSDLAGISIDVTGTPVSQRPRYRRLDASSTIGPIDVVGLLAGANGVHLNSTNGDITLAESNVLCDPQLLGVTSQSGVNIRAGLGGATITGSTFFDCEVSMEGDASLLQAKDVAVRSTYGAASLTMNGVKGVVEVTNATADIFDLKGEEGSIRITDSTVLDLVKAATQFGTVDIDNLKVALGGSVQVETIEGKITVHLARFAGIVSVNTGGSITCDGDGFDNDCVFSSPSDTMNQADGTINCEAQGDCPYRGELIITSELGSIHIKADPWSRAAS